MRDLAPNSEHFDGGKGGVAGFGIRRQRSDAVAYIILFRTAEGRSRRMTIGRHGAPWTPDTARTKAKAILNEATGGSDPAAAKRELREAPTVAEFCERYMAAAHAGKLTTRRGGSKKASTLATDQSRIDSHVLPLLGNRKARSVITADLEAFMHDVADGKTHRREKLEKAHAFRNVRGSTGTASRTIGLLGAVFAYGVKEGICKVNPARGVLRPVDGKRERRLSDDEFALLHDGLEKAMRAAMWPHAVTAARFLTLTGWRSSEAIGLRWQDVDLPRRTARLGDTKTGASTRPLSRDACAVLAAQKATTGGEPAGLVFFHHRGGKRSCRASSGSWRALWSSADCRQTSPRMCCAILLLERWPGKFGQPDRWIFCLTAAMLPRIRSEHDEANETDPQPCFQGEGGTVGAQGREDAG